MKKKVCTSLILILTVFCLAACQTSIHQKDVETIEAQQTQAEDVEFQASSVTIEKPEYSKRETDVIATDLQQKRLSVDNQLSSFAESSDSIGIKRFSENNNLRKIEIPLGTYGLRDMDFERSYYYDDVEMYCAKLKKDNREMRFYFKDGYLIRWVAAPGQVYDRAESHKDFAAYEIELLSEATDLWSDFNTENRMTNEYID